MSARTQLTALNRSVKALQADGRLTDAESALIAMAQGVARQVDRNPTDPNLWREYRLMVGVLMAAGDAGDSDDDAVAALAAAIRTPTVRAEVGDTPDS